MKKMKAILMSMFLVTTLFGCSMKEDTKKMNSDELIVKTNLKNVNAAFYVGQSSNYALPFIVVSSKTLDEKNISFSSNLNLPLPFEMKEEKDREHQYYDLLVNKNLDWKSLATRSNSNDVKQKAAAGEEMDRYFEEYKTSDMGMKGYHTYQITINFPGNDLAKDQDNVITELKMKVNGKESVLNIGKITFHKIDKAADMDTFSELFLGEVGNVQYPNATKSYQGVYDEFQLEAQQDVILNEVLPTMENMKLSSVKVRIKDKAGQTVEKKLSNKNMKLSLKKGDQITIMPAFSTTDDKSTIYHQSYNYQLNYTVNGKAKYRVIESGIVSTAVTGYGVLHQEDLKKQYEDYFFQYVNQVEIDY